MSFMNHDFEGHDVRTVVDETGQEWFVARDVCEALGLASGRSSVSSLPDQVKGVAILPTPGGDQQFATLNEAGVYMLAFRSRKPAAERFTIWVTTEVLPSMRRTGRYQMPGRNQDRHPLAPPYFASAKSDVPLYIRSWLDLTPDQMNARTAAICEARRTQGRAAARLVWEDIGMPPIPPSPVQEHELSAFLRDCIVVTGRSEDFLRAREIHDRAYEYYRANGRPMPGRRRFSNMLLDGLCGDGCIVEPGKVRRLKRSDIGYLGVRLKTSAGTGVPATSAD